MTWAKGTKVSFRVTGEVKNHAGFLNIGCKTFSESQIREVATDIEVVEPPTPYLSGDLVKDDNGVIFFRTDAGWVGADHAPVEPLTLVYRDLRPFKPGDKVRVAAGAEYQLDGSRRASSLAFGGDYYVMPESFWSSRGEGNIAVSRRPDSASGYFVLPEYVTKVPQVGDRVVVASGATYLRDGGDAPVSPAIYTTQDSILKGIRDDGNAVVDIFLVKPEYLSVAE